ncbi:MAG: YicC/YloC family endoribonuclease [Planctomycetaceae bacterium]
MLLSMTGFGEGRIQTDRLALTAEIKSVNNKQLKVSVRSPDSYLSLDHDLERLVRTRIARGSVYINLYAQRLDHAHDQTLDRELLERYWTQVREASAALGVDPPRDVSALLSLPDVVLEARHHVVEEDDWGAIEQTMIAALESLQAFRIHEGDAMAQELARLCDEIESSLAGVVARAPGVVNDYRDKILGRVQELLNDTSERLQPSDVLREVSLFADRCDITEEITRLKCHIVQFRQQLRATQSPGRKLDFLCQEMFREVNTIGSKANDVAISHTTVDMKTSVEKMREIVQNVE